MKKQSKKTPAAPTTVPDDHDVTPSDVIEEATQANTEVTSPEAEQLNERMKLASKPNDGQPLAHRNRSKAGRRG